MLQHKPIGHDSRTILHRRTLWTKNDKLVSFFFFFFFTHQIFAYVKIYVYLNDRIKKNKFKCHQLLPRIDGQSIFNSDVYIRRFRSIQPVFSYAINVRWVVEHDLCVRRYGNAHEQPHAHKYEIVDTCARTRSSMWDVQVFACLPVCVSVYATSLCMSLPLCVSCKTVHWIMSNVDEIFLHGAVSVRCLQRNLYS